LKIIAANRMFSGTQNVFWHVSEICNCDMQFAAYVPDGDGPFSAVFWLSGLTCTEENFVSKAGAQRMASELGMVVIAPDTSPRGPAVPDDDEGAYDFGLGAGFYVNATQAPFSTHYQMRDYIERELFDLICSTLPIDRTRIGIMGHSMGGHGALTIGLRNPEQFKSISAFAPICSPSQCPWGEKALTGYLGADQAAWRDVDACLLIEDGRRARELLVDQGNDDQFVESQLRPDLLEQACESSGIPLTLRRHDGFDHSYFFIASFIDDHLRWHGAALSKK